MRTRLPVVVVTLLALTTIYAAVLYRSIQRYEAWKQAEIQRYNSLEVFPSDASLWLDFSPYTSTSEGGPLFVLGVILACCWLWVIIFLSSYKKKFQKVHITSDAYRD